MLAITFWVWVAQLSGAFGAPNQPPPPPPPPPPPKRVEPAQEVAPKKEAIPKVESRMGTEKAFRSEPRMPQEQAKGRMSFETVQSNKPGGKNGTAEGKAISENASAMAGAGRNAVEARLNQGRTNFNSGEAAKAARPGQENSSKGISGVEGRTKERMDNERANINSLEATKAARLGQENSSKPKTEMRSVEKGPEALRGIGAGRSQSEGNGKRTNEGARQMEAQLKGETGIGGKKESAAIADKKSGVQEKSPNEFAKSAENRRLGEDASKNGRLGSERTGLEAKAADIQKTNERSSPEGKFGTGRPGEMGKRVDVAKLDSRPNEGLRGKEVPASERGKAEPRLGEGPIGKGVPGREAGREKKNSISESKQEKGLKRTDRKQDQKLAGEVSPTVERSRGKEALGRIESASRKSESSGSEKGGVENKTAELQRKNERNVSDGKMRAGRVSEMGKSPDTAKSDPRFSEGNVKEAKEQTDRKTAKELADGRLRKVEQARGKEALERIESGEKKSQLREKQGLNEAKLAENRNGKQEGLRKTSEAAGNEKKADVPAEQAKLYGHERSNAVKGPEGRDSIRSEFTKNEAKSRGRDALSRIEIARLEVRDNERNDGTHGHSMLHKSNGRGENSGGELRNDGQANAHNANNAQKEGQNLLTFSPTLELGNAKYGLEHILRRHSFNTGVENVSKFAQGMGHIEIKGLINEAAQRGAAWEIQGESRVLNINLGRVIGTDQAGNAVSGLRIVTDSSGRVITTYPIPAP